MRIRASVRYVLTGVTIGALTILLIWSQYTHQPDTPALAVGNVLVGIGFAATAALLAGQPAQRGNAALFAAVAFVWTAQQVAAQPVGWFAPVGYFLGAYTQVLAATVLLRYPGRQLAKPARAFVLATFGLASIFAAGEIVTARPEWLGLPAGPWPAILEGQSRLDWVMGGERLWLLGSALVFLWLLRRRWMSLGGIDRRTLAPIVATAGVVALATASRVLGPALPTAGQDVLGIVLDYSAAMLAIAFLLSALQLRLARSSIVELVARTSEPASVESVRDGLREALADPDLEVLYWVAEQGAYVNSAGAITPTSDNDTTKMVVLVADSHGAELAAVVTDVSLSRHQALIDSTVAVSRLALENARLQAGLRFQLAEIHKARARLLHSGLEQRRHLERDLHDGAQQRLLALGMRLGTIETSTHDSRTADAVHSALAELQLALGELRDLAHGLYPATLSQAGLSAALEAVAERLPLPVCLDVPTRRWHPDVESAAYLTVCEALTNAVKHSRASSVTVRVSECGRTLDLRIEDDGCGCQNLNAPGSLPDLRSRVDALGGELRVASLLGTGTTVHAILPSA